VKASVDLSVVIVNWNSGSFLQRLLASLKPLSGELKKIVVIDNASSDTSASSIGANEVTDLIQLEKNQGFARAANMGIGKTESAFVLLLNPDITIVPETVRKLLTEMTNRPRLAIACGALVGENGESQESFQIRPFPTIKSVIKDALFIDELYRVLESSRHALHNKENRDGEEVDQPAAAFWLLRRDAWKQIGGFDESFFPAWFEDVDFCKRLSQAGWRMMFFPQWQIIHRGGVALENMAYKDFLEIYYANLIQYWKKHHRRSLPLIWLPVRLGLSLRRLFAR
jgi:GT2 family glycosyltransferase